MGSKSITSNLSRKVVLTTNPTYGLWVIPRTSRLGVIQKELWCPKPARKNLNEKDGTSYGFNRSLAHWSIRNDPIRLSHA
jgi:hypothetical protein